MSFVRMLFAFVLLILPRFFAFDKFCNAEKYDFLQRTFFGRAQRNETNYDRKCSVSLVDKTCVHTYNHGKIGYIGAMGIRSSDPGSIRGIRKSLYDVMEEL